MYEIKNYIKKPNTPIVDPLQMNDQNKNDFFIELNNQEEMFKVKKILDPQYLEGAIVLKWNGYSLFNLSQWDLIDQLWAYVINLFEEYLSEGEASVFFPEQPIAIKMKKNNGHILLSVEDRTILVPELEFIQCMINEANVFFKTIEEYKLGDYSNELAQVERVREKILNVNKKS